MPNQTQDDEVDVAGHLQRINVRKGFTHAFGFTQEYWVLSSLSQTFSRYLKVDDGQTLAGEVPLQEINCANIKKVERKGQGGRFDVILTNGTVFGFKAKDEIDRTRWLGGFGAVLMAEEGLTEKTLELSLRERGMLLSLLRLAGLSSDVGPPSDEQAFLKFVLDLEALASRRKVSCIESKVERDSQYPIT